MIQYLPVSSTCKLPAIRDEKEQQLLDFLKNLRVADAAKETDLATLEATVTDLQATVTALEAEVAALNNLEVAGAPGDVQTNAGSGLLGYISGETTGIVDFLSSDGTTTIRTEFQGGVLISLSFV